MLTRRGRMIIGCFGFTLGVLGATGMSARADTGLNVSPGAITVGPDGALWFTAFASGDGFIGRITTTGVATFYPVDAVPNGITAGPDGALWFTTGNAESGNTVGRVERMTTSGHVTTTFTVGSGSTNPTSITTGSDGALWFTDHLANRIGRITTGGALTEYTLPGALPGTVGREPDHILRGPDGALWFSEVEPSRMGHITTAGQISSFGFPSDSTRAITGTAVGPDGEVYFTENTTGPNAVARMDSTGAHITEWDRSSWFAVGITAGSDGKLWIASSPLTRFDPTAPKGHNPFTDFSYAGVSNAVYAPSVTTGPDGNIWLTSTTEGTCPCSVDRVTTAGQFTVFPLALPVTPPPPPPPHPTGSGTDPGVGVPTTGSGAAAGVGVPTTGSHLPVLDAAALLLIGGALTVGGLVGGRRPRSRARS